MTEREGHAQLGKAHSWLRVLGFLAWGFVGLSRLWSSRPDHLPSWMAAWLVFGLGYVGAGFYRRLPLAVSRALLGTQTASVMLMPWLGFEGFEGLLLCVVVVQAPTIFTQRQAEKWFAVQFVMLWALVYRYQAAIHILEILGMYSGVSIFALIAYRVQQREVQVAARLSQANAELDRERAKSDRLLKNILPAAIVARLRETSDVIADLHPEVTILFCDVVGFSPLAATMSPIALVELLDALFTRFDHLASLFGLEKIKTIGDAYMAAAGLPQAMENDAEAAADMALGMFIAVAALNRERGSSLRVRIGLNTGPVVAGVIGKQKFAYDLWGDAVNTAARMESHGVVDQVQVTQITYERLKDNFVFESRGEIEIKGKGPMLTWLLKGRAEHAPRPSSPRFVVKK